MKIKLNKQTKLAKLSAYAKGYYSNAESYGELFLPIEFYNEHKDFIDNFETGVDELDGKHSYIECDMNLEIKTLGDFIEENLIYNQDFNEMLIEEFIYELFDYDYDKRNKIFKEMISLTELINSYRNLTRTTEILLQKDYVIEGYKLSKGTLISVENKVNFPSDFVIERKWSI